MLGVGETDLAHGDFYVWVDIALYIDAGRVWENRRILLERRLLFSVVDVFNKVAGVVGAG